MLTQDEIYKNWKEELEEENREYQRELDFFEDEEFEVGTKRRVIQNVTRINDENGFSELNPRIEELFSLETLWDRHQELRSTKHKNRVAEIKEKIEVNKLVIEYLSQFV